jgi:hypothetical protein
MKSVLPMMAAFAIASAGCSGTSNDGAEKAAAIQKNLDTEPPIAEVISGRRCGETAADFAQGDPRAYAHVPGAHVARDGTRAMPDWPPRMAPCYQVSWPPSVRQEPYKSVGAVAIGKFLVDKVGEDEDVTTAAGVIKATPYKAHFVANDMGKALIDAHLATPPSDITDGRAALHKDADGKWIAA